MKKIILPVAAVILAVGGIGAIAANATGTSWQDNLRTAIAADWDTQTETEAAETCEAMSLFGLTDAQSMADFILGMGVTATDLTEDTDVDPASIESLDEAALIASEVIVEECNFS